MIDVKREDVQKDLEAIDAVYRRGIQDINARAKFSRATFRQKIADRRKKLQRLLDVLDTQPEVKEPADAEG